MELALVIYLIGASAKLSSVAITALCISSFAVLGVFLTSFSFLEEIRKSEGATALVCKGLRVLGWVCGLCLAVVVFVPSERTAYTMLAAYGGQSLVESDDFKRVAPKSLQILEKYMDEKLAEQGDHGVVNENQN